MNRARVGKDALLRLPLVKRESSEQEAYLQTDRDVRRWDRLTRESVVVTERPVLKCLGNAQDRGKGRRAMCLVSTHGVPEGAIAWGR